MFSSAVVAVTPSNLFSSAAVADTSVPPNLSPLDVSWDAISKSNEPSANVVLPVIVIVLPSAVILSNAMLPTLVMLASPNEAPAVKVEASSAVIAPTCKGA